MSILSLIGRLSLNTDGFEAGLKKAESASEKFSSNVTAKVGGALAAAFSIYAVERMVDKINETAVEVEHLAKQYQLTTDEVQLLQKATGKLGLEFGNVAGAIGRIQKARAQALGGGEKGDQALGIFGALGVASSTVLNPLKSSVDVMREIVAGSNNLNRSSERNKAEFELLGKNAIQLKSIMVELKNLGPVKLIDSNNIAQAVGAMQEQRRAYKELLMSFSGIAAASSRFFSGAFGEFNDLAENKSMSTQGKVAVSPFVLLKAIYEGSANALYGAPSESDPDLTGEKKRRLDEAMVARRNSKLMHWTGFKEVEQTTAISGIASRGGSGSLANVGGYFFGDQANQSLLSESKKTTYLLEQIEEKTSKIADGFNPEAP